MTNNADVKTSQISSLIQQIQKEAEREEFPIDKPVYEQASKNPLSPILFAGTLESPVCFFARDLGKDEVHAGQPLYGQAGKLVRGGVYRLLYGSDTKDIHELQKAADRVLLTNTMPYKPPGNKAYPSQVKERFRPFLARFLTCYWKGSYIIPLGTEALEWFMPYATKDTFAKFLKIEERFSQTHKAVLTATGEDGKEYKKEITLAPLPHPSPLNQKYFQIFPEMLAKRLEEVKKMFV